MTGVSEPLVSIVTPVHNTADYLQECIESVLAQTYQNWEYIIVNNRSTDGSSEIAQTYAERDNRIRVVHTDNLLPQVANYNFALREISRQSYYCKMVQADDWIVPTCLQQMVKVAEMDQEIQIVGAYQFAGCYIKGEGVPVSKRRTFTILSGIEACRLFFLENRYLFGTPTSVLYRSELVHNREPFYVESGYHEDSELCFDILDRYKFAFVHQVLTCSRVENVSISTTAQAFNPDSLHALIIFKKYGKRYLSEAEYNHLFMQIEQRYYSMLSFNMFKNRGEKFWNYHQRGLALSGLKLDYGRLYRMQLARALNLLGNPKSAIEGILESLKR